MMFVDRAIAGSTPERSVTPPPRRQARAAVAHSPRSSTDKEDVLTNSPVSRQREPIKIRGEDKFASPKVLGKENLRPPSSWGAGLTPTPTPVKTPLRLPTVQEQTPTVEEVGCLPAWDMPAWVLAAAESPLLGERVCDDSLLEDGDGARMAISAAEKSGFVSGPKVRNTFLQFESPLKLYDASSLSPPKTVPPSFAPKHQICGLGDRMPPALPMPQRRDESPATWCSISGLCRDRTASPPSCRSRPQAPMAAPVRPVRLADYLPDMEPEAPSQCGNEAQVMDWNAASMPWSRQAMPTSGAMLGGGCGPTAEAPMDVSYGYNMVHMQQQMPLQMPSQPQMMPVHGAPACSAGTQPMALFGDSFFSSGLPGFGWMEQSMEAQVASGMPGGLCGDHVRPPLPGPRVSICADHFPEPSAAALAAAHSASASEAQPPASDGAATAPKDGTPSHAPTPGSAGATPPSGDDAAESPADAVGARGEDDGDSEEAAPAGGAPQKRSSRRRRGGRRR